MRGNWNLSELRDRGWTPAAIRDFLGEPDALRPNPHARSAAPMRFFLQERVLAAEATEAFRAWRERTAPRREAARIRVSIWADAARDSLRQWAERVPLQLSRLTWKQVLKWSGTQDPRQILNFLRHEQTDYEALLDETYGAVGTLEAKEILRERILEALVQRFPTLAQAADRQRERWRESFG